jgi:hypothetical protein
MVKSIKIKVVLASLPKSGQIDLLPMIGAIDL